MSPGYSAKVLPTLPSRVARTYEADDAYDIYGHLFERAEEEVLKKLMDYHSAQSR
ncbi:MAG: hypothetical protein FWF59_13205 [Turicibacter sp.]|nr:hypothetical protein [Turicibacter sp.]